jgi:RimJ/RimL family protein N-acetyltransferase
VTADEAAARLRLRVEESLPGLARGWYVTGSVADGTAGATSDLDLVVIARDGLSDAERESVQSITRQTATETAVELDLEIVEASRLARGVDPQLKLGSTLLHGDDLVAAAPLVPIEEWARQRMHAAYYLLVSAFGRPPAVREPIDYPRPDDPFFGYALRDVRLPDSTHVPSTRNLVRVSGWMATALLAWRRGRYTARKSECHVLYRQEIGDEWSGFLECVYLSCRERWEYLVPEGETDREELRALCQRMLPFERHYLTLYKEFLLGELRARGERRDRARWMMEQIPFKDEAVEAAHPPRKGRGMFHVRPIDDKDAQEIVSWHYEEPYTMYDMNADDAGFIADPANGYLAVHDEGGDLVAFIAFGPEGQVPGGDYSEDMLDIGAGIRPDRTGQGLGAKIISLAIEEGRKRFGPWRYRATIAAFNGRAQRAAVKAGFVPTSTFERPSDGLPFVILERPADAGDQSD